MGIKGLTKLLQEKADQCMSERDIKSYFGRIIAIDASMCLYQFLVCKCIYVCVYDHRLFYMMIDCSSFKQCSGSINK